MALGEKTQETQFVPRRNSAVEALLCAQRRGGAQLCTATFSLFSHAG
jgi:hypothetical protein